MTRNPVAAASRVNLAARAGRWSAQHRWLAIGIWLAFVLAAVAGGSAVGTLQLDASQMGVGDAGRAAVILDHAFTATSPASETVLVQGRAPGVTPAVLRAATQDVVSRVVATGQVDHLRSPLHQPEAGLVSADGRSLLVTFDLKGPASDAGSRVGPVLAAVQRAGHDHPGLFVGETGEASTTQSINEASASGLQAAERLSIPITLLVLLFAFGSLVAAVLPVALALTAIAAATGLLGFASHQFPVAPTASIVLALLGLAVGVDYSLFYLKREREERRSGKGAEAALLAAAATSGRSILISAVTVLIAVSGLFLVGTGEFNAIAIASMVVVAAAAVGSLTVLPATLSLLGDRVERGRLPRVLTSRFGRSGHDKGASRTQGAWAWVLQRSLRRPVLTAATSVGVLAILAAPVVGIHIASPSNASDLPPNLLVLQTDARIGQAFPGSSASATIVAVAPDVTRPAVRDGVAKVIREAESSGHVIGPVHEATSRDHTVLQVTVSLTGTGSDPTSTQDIAYLRGTAIPEGLGGSTATAYVTGQTAGNLDFDAQMAQRLPYVFALVLVLAFVLLLITFRSLVIPATAIVLNLLSVAAAYGVLVFVFQQGHGESLLGFSSTHSVVSWLPLFLFVILFGLSMDYHVFIISRIREAHDRGMTTADAVSHGIRSTAGTVSAAAVVMVFVFLSFATLDQLSIKEAGIGLATAVLLDATIVRALLLPAAMTLLGEANWWLPRRPRRGVNRRTPRAVPLDALHSEQSEGSTA